MLQLEPVLERRPSQLAEGEKQRVAVGRCIIRDPSCFLFDEPLSRLDVQLREEMRGEIKLVLQGLQRPTIIVTHDQLEALTMADRIAVMRAGLIEQVATPHGIFAKPANLFVAGFIGTPQMNLMPAELEGFGDDGRARFAVEGGQRLALDGRSRRARPAAGPKVTLGIRPRNLELVHEPVDDGLSSVVDIVEPMGAETLAHLNDGRHDMRVVTSWRTPVAEGDRVHVRWQPGQVHVFDAPGEAVRVMSTGTTAAGMSAAQAAAHRGGDHRRCACSALFGSSSPSRWGCSRLGCVLVVVGGLAFNLVPLCQPGRPPRDLWKAALVILIVFVVVLALALGSAWLYGLYLKAQRG